MFGIMSVYIQNLRNFWDYFFPVLHGLNKFLSWCVGFVGQQTKISISHIIEI